MPQRSSLATDGLFVNRNGVHTRILWVTVYELKLGSNGELPSLGRDRLSKLGWTVADGGDLYTVPLCLNGNALSIRVGYIPRSY